MTAPAPFLPPTDSAVEQHFTPAQVAQQWGVSARTVQRLFASTPGVLKLGTKGKHVSLRIPARLLKAHYAKLSALRVSHGVRITKSGGTVFYCPGKTGDSRAGIAQPAIAASRTPPWLP